MKVEIQIEQDFFENLSMYQEDKKKALEQGLTQQAQKKSAEGSNPIAQQLNQRRQDMKALTN